MVQNNRRMRVWFRSCKQLAREIVKWKLERLLGEVLEELLRRRNVPVNMRHKGLVLPSQREVCMMLTVGCDLRVLNVRRQTQHPGPRGCRKTAGPPRVSGLIQQTFNPFQSSFLSAMTEDVWIQSWSLHLQYKLWLPHPHSFKIATSPTRGKTKCLEMITSRFRLFSSLHTQISQRLYNFYYLLDIKNNVCPCISFL